MKTKLVLAALALCLLAGCTYVQPSHRELIAGYRVASDATLKRVQVDAVTPQWVKDSAAADNKALRAIDALSRGVKVEDLK